MIKQDAITDLLMKMNRFYTKRGTDLASRQELMKAINAIVGEESLGAIYVNTTNNALIPDVAVLQLFNVGFSAFLLNPDSTNLCPYGYTLEIHDRCFDKYTEEEIVAVILHDILQNVQSDSARIRLLRAYTAVLNKHSDDVVLEMFEKVNLDEVLYIAFTGICLRPFKAPVKGCDFVGTDEVLKTMGLDDAYDSYLEKILPVSTLSPEDRMARDVNDDIREMTTIIDACLDNDIRHYYHVIRTSAPLISLSHIISNGESGRAIGMFNPRRINYKPRKADSVCPIVESYNNIKSEVDIRWQVDKIINAMRYAETEAERDVVLFKIKELSLKLAKLEDKLDRGPSNPRTSEQIRKIREFREELDVLRKKTMDADIKTKHWHIYVKDAMPSGYDF